MNTEQFPESESLSMPNDDLRIEFDAADLSVRVERGDYSSTFEDANRDGLIANEEDAYQLTDRQYSWLQSQQDYVEQWLAYWTGRKKTPATHTPGPWVLDECDWPMIINPPEHVPGLICTVELPKNSTGLDRAGDEAVANARLIAAAPELLEALEEAQDYLYRTNAEPVGSGRFPKIDAAINKAKGIK